MLVPILHRVLIEPEDVETKTASGIVLAVNEKAERKAVERGKVVAVGDTAFREFKADVVPQVGDMVYFAKYAGKTIMDGEKEHLLINDEDILAVIR